MQHPAQQAPRVAVQDERVCPSCTNPRQALRRMELVTISDIADHYGTSAQVVRDWKAKGKLPEPATLLDNKPVWLLDEVERYVALVHRDPRSMPVRMSKRGSQTGMAKRIQTT